MTHTSLPYDARTTAADVLEDVDLTGHRFLVTGGGSGIGAEITRSLARAGADVVVGVRNPRRVDDDLTGALASRVHLERLDLDDTSAVAAFAAAWRGRLDALIANAGIMAFPYRQVDSSGWEHHLSVNFLAHFVLAHGLRAALSEGGGGRLVVVSSGAHRDAGIDVDDPQFQRRPYDRWVAYAQSKTADILFAAEAARRWADDGIVANSLNPGWVMTGLQRHLDGDTLRDMGAIDDAGNVIPQPYSKTLAEGAAPSVLLAASPLTAQVTGRYFEDNQPAAVDAAGPGGLAPHAADHAAAEWLWDLATLSGQLPR